MDVYLVVGFYMELFTDIGFDWKDICLVMFTVEHTGVSCEESDSCLDRKGNSFSSDGLVTFSYGISDILGYGDKMSWSSLLAVVSESEGCLKIKHHIGVGKCFLENMKK